MDSQEIARNREIIIEELLATKRAGIEGLIEQLDGRGFFGARLSEHDTGEGGMANHALWLLKFAREAGIDLPEESLPIVCLLHDVMDQTLFRKAGFELLPEERDVAALLERPDRRAVEYAAGIPFTAEQAGFRAPKVSFEPISMLFDEEDHRLWWDNIGADDFSYCKPIEATLLVSMCLHKGGTEPDCAIVMDENGAMAFMYLYEISEDGKALMQSDRTCFAFADFTFYISRYPQYRPSYIMAQRLDGKWGAFSIKDNFGKKNRFPIMETTPIARFENRNKEAAFRSMKSRKGYPIRVRHSDFYIELTLSEQNT